MNIHTIHSKSHNRWHRIITDSLLANCNDYTLFSKRTAQVSETGEYGSRDIIKFWYLKTRYILEILEKAKKPFLYADTDIYFFRDFVPYLVWELGDNDIIAQYSKKAFGIFPIICAGFMYMKPNDRVKKMFAWVLNNLEKYGNDERAINRYLYTHRIKWAALSKDYYSINFDNGNKLWAGEEVEITVKNPFMAHINWAIGLENRLNLLQMIKKHYEV